MGEISHFGDEQTGTTSVVSKFCGRRWFPKSICKVQKMETKRTFDRRGARAGAQSPPAGLICFQAPKNTQIHPHDCLMTVLFARCPKLWQL
jgi:hypothetical protein